MQRQIFANNVTRKIEQRCESWTPNQKLATRCRVKCCAKNCLWQNVRRCSIFRAHCRAKKTRLQAVPCDTAFKQESRTRNAKTDIALPEQCMPSPEYPCRQEQLKEPNVLLQWAFTSQVCVPLSHSSTSAQIPAYQSVIKGKRHYLVHKKNIFSAKQEKG